MVVLLAAVGTARTLVAVAPLLRFDSDPAIVPGAFAGIAPATSLLLDGVGAAAVALLAAARLLRSQRARRAEVAPRSPPGRSASHSSTESALVERASPRIAPLLVAALLPLPAFLALVLSPSGGFTDLWRGVTWLVAAMAAAMIAGCDRSTRTIVTGALAGAVAAMALRGTYQLLVEHPALVADFETSRDAFLASRGWTPGSAAARAYERRLSQPEASGWFGLANVFSGVMVVAVMRMTLLAWSSRRADQTAIATSGPSTAFDRLAGVLCAVVAMAAMVLILINGSKGAIGALLVGAAVLPLLLFVTAAGRAGDLGFRRRWLPRALALLTLLPLAAAFMRGALPGESGLGERSMLFRWHYTIGSLRSLVEAPLTGVGAGGFQDAYTRLRPGMSPEEVMSAHSAFLDWLAAFGVSGLGMVALSVMLLVRALRAPLQDPSLDAQPSAALGPATPSAVLPAAGAAGLGSALAMGLTSSTDLTADGVSLRLLAMVISMVVAAAVARTVERGEARLVMIGGALAALVLMVHAQLDMDFWLSGSAWWCWLLLGSTAAADARPWHASVPAGNESQRASPPWLERGTLAVAGVIACAGACALGIMSLRAASQERAAEQAALAIEHAIARGQPPPRSAAAQALEHAAAVIPSNAAIWGAAVEQSLRAIDLVPRDQRALRREHSSEALRLATRAYAARPELSTARLLVDAHYLHAIERRRDAAGSIAPGPASTEDAAGAAADAALLASIDAAIVRDPRSLALWRRSVEARSLLGDTAGAAAAAQRTLEVDASFALDPLRQLTERDRAALDRIIASQPQGESPPPR